MFPSPSYFFSPQAQLELFPACIWWRAEEHAHLARLQFNCLLNKSNNAASCVLLLHCINSETVCDFVFNCESSLSYGTVML